MLRNLVKRPGGESFAAHFKGFEEASDEVLDELIVSAEDMLELSEKELSEKGGGKGE